MNKKRLLELNEKLSNLEKTIKAKIVTFYSELAKNLKNKSGEIIDFEMELEINLYDFQDALITQFRDLISKKKLNNWQFDDGKNHNDFFTLKHHTMFGERQCWLYHSLYDHLDLTLEQMLKIESVWWDINVSYQYGNKGFNLNTKMVKMYLDDIRIPNNNYDVIVRNYDEAIEFVKINGIPSFISFDHDLGCDAVGNILKSGYDFAKWLVEMDIKNIYKFPDNFTFNIHSANPIGKNNINAILNNYLAFKIKYKDSK